MATITVHARPGAKQNSIAGQTEGIWQVRVAAPAVEGKANAALLKYLAEVLGVRKSAVTLRHGERSRGKVVEVEGLSQTEAEERLQQHTRA
ncbi:MAG: DUF167 domain-containing protein [Chloroflexota bacterium]|nr:MAG: DUF167 domain-containing protein [Chloroflexota bacterium]